MICRKIPHSPGSQLPTGRALQRSIIPEEKSHTPESTNHRHYHPENSAVMEYPETILCHEYPCACPDMDQVIRQVPDLHAGIKKQYLAGKK